MKPNRHDSERKRNESLHALAAALNSLESDEEVCNFMLDLCTPAELQALVDRWQVVLLLQQGLPYRQIHDMTGVSVTTVGRVARFLASGFGGYSAALERGAKN